MGIMSGIMATALAASMGVCGVSAAGGSFARVCDTAGSYARAGISRAYADADGDGICDNYGKGNGAGYVDADGDGVCDNCGGRGRGYVDADGDGVCDNWGTRVRPQDGTGYGANGGHGAGRGRAH